MNTPNTLENGQAPDAIGLELRAGDRIQAGEVVGVIIADLADDLTFEPGSYECDLGHGYSVVRHRSEVKRIPNTEP